MSTSSLLKGNDIVWELVKNNFLLSRILLFISRDQRQIFRHARSGKVFKINVVVFKERMAQWLRLNKLLVFSYC